MDRGGFGETFGPRRWSTVRLFLVLVPCAQVRRELWTAQTRRQMWVLAYNTPTVRGYPVPRADRTLENPGGSTRAAEVPPHPHPLRPTAPRPDDRYPDHGTTFRTRQQRTGWWEQETIQTP